MSDELIKIFNELYIGFNIRSRTEIEKDKDENGNFKYKRFPYNLGFITPYEDNAAGRKRQETVNSWASKDEYEWVQGINGKPGHRARKEKPDHLKPHVIKNEQLEGFKLSQEIRRSYWGGGNVVWRIEDPRGFEIEISSSNLARIIDEVGILPGGVIPGKCIYGRSGKDNIIIPEGTELWNKSVKDAEEIERRSKIVGATQVIPGAICELKSGKFVYLGHMFVTRVINPDLSSSRDSWFNYRNGLTSISDIVTNSKTDYFGIAHDRYHVFYQEAGAGIHANIVLYKDKKVISVSENKDEFADIAKNIKFVNSFNGDISFAASGKSTYDTVSFVATINKPQNVDFKKERLTEDERQKIFYDKRDYSIRCDKIKSNLGTGYSNLNSLAIINDDGWVLNTMHLLAKQGQEVKNDKTGGYEFLVDGDIHTLFIARINELKRFKTDNPEVNRRMGYFNNINSWQLINSDHSSFKDKEQIVKNALNEIKKQDSWYKIVIQVDDEFSYMIY